MKTSKILVSLLLLSQVMVAGPGKDKVSFVFKKFETLYPEHSPERISSFSSEELRSKHKALHNDDVSFTDDKLPLPVVFYAPSQIGILLESDKAIAPYDRELKRQYEADILKAKRTELQNNSVESQFNHPEQTIKTLPSEFSANKARELLMEGNASNKHDRWYGEFDAYGHNFGALPYGSLGAFPFDLNRSSNEQSSAVILTAVIAAGNQKMDAAVQHVISQINDNTPTTDEIGVD